MNDAQVWTLIGLFLASMASMIGLTMRTVRAEISSLGAFLGGRIDTLDARFSGLEARFSGLEARFNGVDDRFNGLERRIDHLDRDVQTVINRLMEG